ncbi:TPA: lipopolysaccharide biosynthesis protein [Streptococcus suis]
MNKLKLNSLSALIFQIITLISGLIIPQLLLTAYGTEQNGLNYSISQMLSIISFFDFGVAAVAQATLYKPLHKRDIATVSGIYNSINRYFNKLSLGLLIYILFLCIYYGTEKSSQYSWVYTTTLVLAISISLIGQYALGISNQVLLSADQKMYIYMLINTIATIINIISTYVLVHIGYSIQLVRLISSIIFLIRPIFLKYYVKKHYSLLSISEVGYRTIPNQWSGLIQHIAVTLTSSLDSIILTLLSTFSNVSIYSIYAFPLNGVRLLIESIGSGYKSHFGAIFVREEDSEISLIESFSKFEWLINFLSVVLFCVMTKVLIPFVIVYTKEVKDANYSQPIFGFILMLAFFLMNIKIPYTTVINAVGHFKETQSHSLIEIVINVALSVILVGEFGLVGVAIGTAISIFYRIIVSIIYLRKFVLKFSLINRLRILIVDTCTIIIFLLLSSLLSFEINTYFSIFIYSIVCVLLATLLYILISGLFYRKMIMNFRTIFNRRKS